MQLKQPNPNILLFSFLRSCFRILPKFSTMGLTVFLWPEATISLCFASELSSGEGETFIYTDKCTVWTDKKIHEQHHEGGEGVLKLGFVQNLHNKGVRQLSSDYRMTKPRTGSFKKEKKLSKKRGLKTTFI